MAGERTTAQQWKRNRSRVVSIGTAILAFLILGMIVLVLGPVRTSLRVRDRRQAEGRIALVHGEVSSFFAQTINIATQVPSRTRIREEFVAYLQGGRSLEEYREFATSKLQDAIDGSDAIHAVRRLDRNGTTIVSIGFPSVDGIPVDGTEVRILNRIETVNDHMVFLVLAPIVDPGYGHVGWDAVAIDAEPLQRAIARAADSLEDAIIRVGAPGQEGISAGTVPEGRFYRFDFELTDQWTLVCQIPFRTIHADTRRIVTILILVIIVIGSLALTGNGLALAALTRRSAEEAQELATLVEDRTKELRRALDEKRVLMREIHHRIKNDMHIVQSLISLQIEQGIDSGSGEILKDARSVISLMQRIYEHLYQQDDYGDVAIKPILSKLLEEDIKTIAATKQLTITTDIQNLVLPRRVAVPIGIIVNELAVNSIKYGRQSVHDPSIIFSLHLTEDNLEISMRDNGPGFPDSTIRGTYGYGMSMVEALVQQFRGSIRLMNDRGARVEIMIPTPEIDGSD